MTSQPEDPLVYHGGRAGDPFREERDRGDHPSKDEASFAPRGVDDRQRDAPTASEVAFEEGADIDDPVGTTGEDSSVDQPAADDAQQP